MADNDKIMESIDEVVKQVTDAVKPYVDMAMPYLEKAKEAAEPYVKEAREKAEPYVREAREKAEPVFDEVKTRAAKVTEKTEVFLQYGDYEMRVEDIVERAREDYYARGGDRHSLKVLRLYLKPEDRTAYYVANNDETGKVGF